MASRRFKPRKPASTTPGERVTQADINRQLRRWTPRRITSWSLAALALIIAAQHLLAHGGFQPIPISMGWQDILIGYPTALMVGIAAMFVADPRGSI